MSRTSVYELAFGINVFLVITYLLGVFFILPFSHPYSTYIFESAGYAFCAIYIFKLIKKMESDSLDFNNPLFLIALALVIAFNGYMLFIIFKNMFLVGLGFENAWFWFLSIFVSIINIRTRNEFKRKRIELLRDGSLNEVPQ